jgi:hypothetical protein
MPKHKKQNQRQKQKRWEKQQQRNNKNNNNKNNNNYNKNNYNKNNNYDNNNSINNYDNKNINNKKYMSKKERNAYRKKKNRRKDEIDEEFIKDLEKLGYFIREVGGDGNCLFRSVSDQMDNTEKNHKLYREICINYMEKNKDEFAPFIEDDETYDKYLERMGEDGEWGGNLEIYALSKALNANFYIYIHKHPMYIVNNFEKPKKNILMTYHEGKHYNSLRKLEEKNNEDKEKEEKRKKEKLENGDDKDDNDEEEEEEDDDNEDINNLISKVDHLNI